MAALDEYDMHEYAEGTSIRVAMTMASGAIAAELEEEADHEHYQSVEYVEEVLLENDPTGLHDLFETLDEPTCTHDEPPPELPENA